MRSFRLGSTSYVYPDDILPNVRQLDIEKVITALSRAEFRGVLTLEVFGIDDFLSSKRVLDEVLAGWADDSL